MPWSTVVLPVHKHARSKIRYCIRRAHLLDVVCKLHVVSNGVGSSRIGILTNLGLKAPAQLLPASMALGMIDSVASAQHWI